MTAYGRIVTRQESTLSRRSSFISSLNSSFLRKQESREGIMTKPVVYILASARNGTLYTGVTSDLVRRVYEHKNNLVDGFTRKYKIHALVYYEIYESMKTAITREKQIKKWKRDWKIQLIEQTNPEWNDLWESIL